MRKHTVLLVEQNLKLVVFVVIQPVVYPLNGLFIRQIAAHEGTAARLLHDLFIQTDKKVVDFPSFQMEQLVCPPPNSRVQSTTVGISSGADSLLEHSPHYHSV